MTTPRATPTSTTTPTGSMVVTAAAAAPLPGRGDSGLPAVIRWWRPAEAGPGVGTHIPLRHVSTDWRFQLRGLANGRGTEWGKSGNGGGNSKSSFKCRAVCVCGEQRADPAPLDMERDRAVLDPRTPSCGLRTRRYAPMGLSRIGLGQVPMLGIQAKGVGIVAEQVGPAAPITQVASPVAGSLTVTQPSSPVVHAFWPVDPRLHRVPQITAAGVPRHLSSTPRLRRSRQDDSALVPRRSDRPKP